MSELETSALRIGTWVADTAISIWLDHSAAAAYGEETLEARVPSVLLRRRLMRVFDQIADTVAEWLVLDASSQLGLPEQTFARQLSDVAQALLDVSNEHADHLQKWRDPVLLASLISSEASMVQPDGIVLASCVALREVVSQMRTGDEAQIPENLIEIPDLVEGSLRAISRGDLNSPRDEPGAIYGRSVIEAMGLSQGLSSFFVEPRLQFIAHGGGEKSVRPMAALARSPRLIVQGDPGSGKTTLLQWLAVSAAQRGLSGEELATNAVWPFFVRLRDWPKARQGAVARLADLVAMSLDFAVPPQLLQQRLADGSALLLIDGLDELPSRPRADAWDWLRFLAAQFPTTSMVVTTRPSAMHALPSIDGFQVVGLLPMDNEQISTYVHKWFATDVSNGNPAPYMDAILGATAISPHVARLASSPLTCDLLCTLTMKRRMVLPRMQDIYAAFLDLLLDLKESAPGGASSGHLSRIQSIVLLRQIAYWFLINEYAEADRKEVLHLIGLELRNMPEIDRSPEYVLGDLVGSTAVLRESVPGRIDFLHQTIAEYLAARALIDQGAIGSLVAQAHLETWSDVAVLAAGQATEADCLQLLNGLLNRASSETRYRSQLLDTARSCIRDRPDLQSASLELSLQRIAGSQASEDASRLRLIVAVDIANFAAANRTNAHQLSMSGGLDRILQHAFNRAGVPWELSTIQYQGDGLVVLAPPKTHFGRLLTSLPGEISAGIQEFNASRSAEANLRLRMAVHSGLVHTGRDGISGTAVIETARLLDSHEVKDALRSSSAALAVILSDLVHKQLNDASTRYHSCMATIKSGQIKAWVGLFGDGPGVGRDGPRVDDLSLHTAMARLTDRARVSLAQRGSEISLAEMKERAAAAVPPRDSLTALRRPGIGVIAEMPFVQSADAVRLAKGLEIDGALAIGLGFEELPGEMLTAVRAATSVPLLCTDLVISPYQIFEARAWGADMVRLLVAALTPRALASLCDLTEELGMSAMVSVQSTTEADHALEAGARLISIAAAPADPIKFSLIAGDMPLDVFTIAADARNESDVITFEHAGAAAVLVSRELTENEKDPRALIRRMTAAGEYGWSSKLT